MGWTDACHLPLRVRAACRRTAGLLALALVVLLQLYTCYAQESVMDKNGDGVVTPEEFVEHAAAQEA